MSKFDNSMFKTWQHMLNVEGDNNSTKRDNESLIREDERKIIAKKLLELGVESEIIFSATGVSVYE
ncbi:hypothetical protein [Clostridium sp. B9]|uniref:hypothetical protein n=1 Tax=Clostridium sp. B9 TaxID=3423224 RepID=UPI003D2EE64B